MEIAKPLFLSPQNQKGFPPSVKDGFRSFLFVVTACRNGREASLPEKALGPAAEQKQNETEDSPPGPPPGEGAALVERSLQWRS